MRGAARWLCLCVAAHALLHCAAAMSGATVVSAPAAFGSTKDGTAAHVYTLKSEARTARPAPRAPRVAMAPNAGWPGGGEAAEG